MLSKKPFGQNHEGRPKDIYIDQISKHVSADNLTADEIVRLASDKSGWNRVVVPKKLAR